MDWWIWLVVGLGFLGAEVVLPGGFFLMFFGLGAVVVGLLAFAGLLGPLWAQLGLFTVVSAGSMTLLRSRMIEGLKPAAGMDERLADLVGAAVIMSEDAPAHGRGKADYRGAPWNVLNTGEAALAKGQRAKVLGVDGLTLRVVKE